MMEKNFTDGRVHSPLKETWPSGPCIVSHKYDKTCLTSEQEIRTYFLGCTASNNIGEWHKPIWMQWRSYEKDCPVILVLGREGVPNFPHRLVPSRSFFSSSLFLMSCQCYSELDPVGWLWCLVWNRAGCSAKVSPQVIACRNWSWCWCRDRSRRIQI